MNLPAEAVVIVGDERYDAGEGAAKALEAHELLNAAGRAGRAGLVSQGVVVVVPGRVVQYEPEKGKITTHWMDLQERVFSKTDQYLNLQDPIQVLLDYIQSGEDTESSLFSYLVNRVPLSGTESSNTCKIQSKYYSIIFSLVRIRSRVSYRTW